MRKSIFIFVVLCGASFLGYHFKPRQMLADIRPQLVFNDVIPAQFSTWVNDPHAGAVVVDPTQLELVDKLYNQTVSRTYVNSSGDRVMLSIAYGKDQSEAMQVHTPESCYPAQGFKISDSQHKSLSIAGKNQPVVQLVARAGNRIEPITYWVVVGDEVANEGARQRRDIRFKYGFKGFVPDGVFFRVSSIGGDVDHQYAVQQKFLEDLFQKMDSPLKTRLAGA